MELNDAVFLKEAKVRSYISEGARNDHSCGRQPIVVVEAFLTRLERFGGRLGETVVF